MPPRNNSLPRLRRGRGTPPPPVMTWKEARPILVAAGVLDLFRLFFNMFWFFGPALAALYCVNKVGEWVGSLAGITSKVCDSIATIGGVALAKITIPLGVVMADATALLGFLTLGLWVLISNARLFKTVGSGWLKLGGGFAISVIPLVGALPAFTFSLWRLYGAQIKTEEATYTKWQKANAAAQLQQQRQQMGQLAQMRASQQVQTQEQALQQEEAQYAALQQAQAANDAQYEIPEDEKMAA